MKRHLVLCILFVGFAASAAAELQLDYQTNTSKIEPGQKTLLGELNVTAQETSHNQVTVTIALPFNTSVQPGTVDTLEENTSQVFQVYGSPTRRFPGNEYSSQITAESSETTNSLTASVTVLVDPQWNLTTDSINNTISVGSQGVLGESTVFLTGNSETQVLDTTVTGNISGIVAVPSRFRVYSYNNYTLAPSYQLARDQRFGFFNGSVNVTGAGFSKTVDLEARVEDRIEPDFVDFEVEDVMSTKSVEHRVTVSDNLNISSVTARYTRTVEVVRNNTTVQVNRTVAEVNFSNENGDRTWKHEFGETSEIGPYYVNITAQDSAGNQVSELQSFQVDGLDAVNVLDSNFQFEAVNPTTAVDEDSKAVHKIIELRQDTPVTLRLTSLTHSSSNTTLPENIGVLKPGAETATTFGGEDGTVEISEEGTYKLVVQSNKVESYQGDVKVEPVPQHVPIQSLIQFEGQIKDPAYPDCGNMSIGEFTGRICFADPDKAVQDRIKFTATAPASDCKGVNSWNQCIAGYSLGEIPELKQRINTANRDRNIAAVFGFFCLFFAGLTVRRVAAKNNIIVAHRVKEEDYNKEFTEQELREYGVVN